jgi:hypothetical protein
LETGGNRILLFVQEDHLDLCHTPIHEQFDASDITPVIRREERGGLCDFVRTSHPTHRHGGYNARLELLDLFFEADIQISPTMIVLKLID